MERDFTVRRKRQYGIADPVTGGRRKPKSKKGKVPVKLLRKGDFIFVYFPTKKISDDHIMIFDGKRYHCKHIDYLLGTFPVVKDDALLILNKIGRKYFIIGGPRRTRRSLNLKSYLIKLTQEEHDIVRARYGTLSRALRKLAYISDQKAELYKLFLLEDESLD